MSLQTSPKSGKKTTEASTRERIMDAAQELFVVYGFNATSLRQITQRAKVNLAAVNYHFGSKENLIVEMLASGIRGLNERRLEMLSEYEKGKKLTLEQVFDAMYRPAFEFFADGEERKKNLLSLLMRANFEGGEVYRILFEREWRPVVERFFQAIQKAEPRLSQSELLWRCHFSMGAMVFALNSHGCVMQATRCFLTKTNTMEAMKSLISYSAAGLRAGISGGKRR